MLHLYKCFSITFVNTIAICFQKNLNNIATENVTEIRGDESVAKSSEQYTSIKTGCLKF